MPRRFETPSNLNKRVPGHLWRLVVAFMALVLLASACGSDSSDNSDSSDSAAETEQSSDSTSSATDEPATDEPAAAEKATIRIESWRSDDLSIWTDQIIPAFEASHPGISVEFEPTPPADYNAALSARLAGGTAGDLITCRPFDASLELYEQGNLASLEGLDGLDGFSPVAQSAWITDDQSVRFCVPMASVIHGFYYNTEIFDELGLDVPTDRDEFFDVLAKIKADGNYEPLALGTADQWEAATVGFQNVGPNYWDGEAGRLALIQGQGRFTDSAYVETFEELAQWGEYLPKGASALAYNDAQNLFTLGRAAIYPGGSWEITGFNENADFDYSVFRPLAQAGASDCYISDHTDIGIGLNPGSANPEAAKTFLSWVASSEFAELYANALPGFYSLQNVDVALSDPVAQSFQDWRGECESTIRNSYQILSRGEPNLEDELWATSAGVLNGDLTPEEATQRLQDGLDRWYEPVG